MESQTKVSQRHLVASFPSYGEAARALDALSDESFPVEQLTIVGDQLRFVENVTGRKGYGTEALSGAASGAVIGATVGFFLGLFSLIDPLISGLALAFYGALFGAAVGVVVGVLSHWVSAGRRDFTSVRSVEAGRYDVVADTVEHAEHAAQRLGSRPIAEKR